MLEKVANSPSLKQIETLFKKQKAHLLLEHLNPAAKALFLSYLIEKEKTPLLIITDGLDENALYENLQSLQSYPILELPAWETLPGEEIPPSMDIIGKRFNTLYELSKIKTPCILLCSLQALLQKVILKNDIEQYFFKWKKGSIIKFENLPQLLTSLGYQREAVVSDKGEFAIRGGIVDIFPLTSTEPFRIDFFGDEIESIRTFDPSSQKSIQKEEDVIICAVDEASILLEEENGSILEYFDSSLKIVFEDIEKIEDRYLSLKGLPSFKSKLIESFEEFTKRATNFSQIHFASHSIEELSPIEILSKDFKEAPYIQYEHLHTFYKAFRIHHPFTTLDKYLAENFHEEELSFEEASSLLPLKKCPTIYLYEHEQFIKKKKDTLSQDIQETAVFEKGYLSHHVILSDLPLAILPEAEFTHRKKIRRQKNRTAYHTPAAEFHALEPGDLVVHYHSGIGKFLGIEKQKTIEGNLEEFFALEYANRTKLFVPISQAYLINRYIGANELKPDLTNLSNNKWQKTKALAQKQIIGYAQDLLTLYAEREMSKGFLYSKDSDEMLFFEEEFPYIESPDQVEAITSIKEDMTSEKTMDRLICGDVGYGKTEVAMRAAFKAVVDGKKQVAVLVPTTVLALQHGESFQNRMNSHPINVAVISRFNPPAKNKEILEKTASGAIDILIGTHRILSQDVQFKDLGLIIIDEEQRFGVRAKEHLKKMKKNVDALSMSATPIPRTLYMSLIKIRDLSVINTPPQDRLPIKTIMAENHDEIIKNACLREMSRGGQIFFIHNRVETIYKRAEHLESLLPNAKIGIVHGQMTANAADHIFHQFKLGLIDILFATTIVENGVDIPNANTIIIDRADTFGLAALYQLRGRVGRWNRTSYAYLITPARRELSEIARKRLSALVEASGQGGGMKIAMRDLEIRGAGDLLGVKQSGQIASIGLHLYCKLLKKTIVSLKQQKQTSFIETKLEFPYPASLPASYLMESSLRMEMYHRLGETSSYEEVDAIFNEMIDRFGPLPEETLWLYHISRIRIFANFNQFSLLKMGKMILIAKKHEGKKEITKNMMLSKKSFTPKELEEEVLKLLAISFSCQLPTNN